jgi:hypothetical protein
MNVFRFRRYAFLKHVFYKHILYKHAAPSELRQGIGVIAFSQASPLQTYRSFGAQEK